MDGIADSLQEFVERQARFQLGRVTSLSGNIDDLFANEWRRRSSIFNGYIPSDEKILYSPKYKGPHAVKLTQAKGDWKISDNASKGYRITDVVNDTELHGLAHPAFFDMQDGVRNARSRVPVFQYNRVSTAENAVLWPLRGFHDIGTERFIGLHKDDIPTEQKQPTIYWRGAMAGHSTLGGGWFNPLSLVKKYLEGNLSEEDLLCHLRTLPRFRFMEFFFGHPKFDIGFVLPPQHKSFSKIPAISQYCKPHADRQDHYKYKIQVALSGNDAATSFPWQCESKCVVIRADFEWQIFYDAHFFPSVHYWKVRSDFSDFLEVVDRIENSPDECKAMIDRSNEVCRLLADPELRDAALRRTVELYGQASA